MLSQTLLANISWPIPRIRMCFWSPAFTVCQ